VGGFCCPRDETRVECVGNKPVDPCQHPVGAGDGDIDEVLADDTVILWSN